VGAATANEQRADTMHSAASLISNTALARR
jgi:hypothetical protein